MIFTADALQTILMLTFFSVLIIFTWKRTAPVIKFFSLSVLFGSLFISARLLEFLLPMLLFLIPNLRKNIALNIFTGILCLWVNVSSNIPDAFYFNSRWQSAFKIIDILDKGNECRGKIYSYQELSGAITFFLYPKYIPLIDGYVVWHKKRDYFIASYLPTVKRFFFFPKEGIKCIVWRKNPVVKKYLRDTKFSFYLKYLYEDKNFFLAYHILTENN